MTRSIPWPRILAEGVAIVVSILGIRGIGVFDSFGRYHSAPRKQLREAFAEYEKHFGARKRLDR